MNEITLLNFQLDLIKSEINQIQTIIGRIDTLTQQVKNWTVVTWAGSISLILGNADNSLRHLILGAAVIPLLFWMVDGHYRRRQLGFILRIEKISNYLNSEALSNSFEAGRISNFILLDLSAKLSGRQERAQFANLTKAMWFKSLRVFYLGLIITTIILQIILYYKY